MIRIANLKIDPIAPELLPESLARGDCVLPLGLDGDCLRVVIGRRADYRETIEKLEFILNRRLIWAVADHRRLEEAIDEVYSYLATEVENCPLDFRFECPKKWLELRPSGRADVRYCESCNRHVHLCADENEAMEQARAGQCIAIYRQIESECVETIGLMESFPIEEEHVQAFRSALRSFSDPLATKVADEGEISFLDTKVFEQDYMEFCENFAANPRYPPESRAEMRLRSEAIRPYLGLPILHGGISHEGINLNVFIDKANGTVIHLECDSE